MSLKASKRTLTGAVLEGVILTDAINSRVLELLSPAMPNNYYKEGNLRARYVLLVPGNFFLEKLFQAKNGRHVVVNRKSHGT